MKRMIKINFLIASMTVIFFSAHGQQKPSQRSFASVVNEVKQQKAMRDRMMQQVKQAGPANTVSQNANVQPQPLNTNTTGTAQAQQSTGTVEQANKQPASNKQLNQQPRPRSNLKKE